MNKTAFPQTRHFGILSCVLILFSCSPKEEKTETDLELKGIPDIKTAYVVQPASPNNPLALQLRI
jgi:hypothetical protein